MYKGENKKIMNTYEKKNFPRTAYDFVKMEGEGKLSFDNAVQRSFVWKNTEKDNRMSMLIDSMLRGFPIPPMYCNRLTIDAQNKKFLFDFLDGKQRTKTLISFLKDEFYLIGLPTFKREDGEEVDLNGKKYSELSVEYQDIIRTYSITVYYYDDMPQEDAEEMFCRLNNGKKLTNIEFTRANAVSKQQISNLGKHRLFEAALSAKSFLAYVNEDIVIKTWILLFDTCKSLENKNVLPNMKNAVFTQEQVSIIENCFDKVYEVIEFYKSKKKRKSLSKKILTKTHLVSIMPMINQSIIEKKAKEDVADWLESFFIVSGGKATISDIYNSCATKGSAREEMVKKRLKEIEISYQKFFGNETIK